MSDEEEDRDEAADAESEPETDSGEVVQDRPGAPEPSEPEAELDEQQEEDLRKLLRGALTPEGSPADNELLEGVQRRLRERSGGKFYADGWSTAKHPPIATYLLTSLFMLGIVLAAYLILGFLQDEAVEVDNTPAPVRLVPPRPIPPSLPSR